MKKRDTKNAPLARRPNLFRALGPHEPPREIVVDGVGYTHQKTVKHDSWAATAVYQSDSAHQDVSGRVVCKFNRIWPLLFLPCGALGRWLAARETAMYRRLADVPGVPRGCKTVEIDGRVARHVAAHHFVEGHPLRWDDRVKDSFFDQLSDTIDQLHQRNVAYVDMNKWENIIVDEQGDPHLIDFQISLYLPRVWPLSSLLRILQQSDLYHLNKHARRIRPDLYADRPLVLPWWIRVHRRVANPFRKFRRGLLVALGIRRGEGKPQSEAFIEDGLREIGDSQLPITRLYRLLRCPTYANTIDPQVGFVRRAFVDLMNRPPQNGSEQRYLESLAKATPHDQVIWLLKSDAFFATSQQWDAAAIEAVIRRIERQWGVQHETRAA